MKALLTLLLVCACAGNARAQPADSLGNWLIRESQRTGAVLATLEARDARTVLGIRCDNRRTYAFIAWDAVIGRNPVVTYRIDAEPPATQRWNASADTASAFVPGHTVDVVRRMALHDSLSASVVSSRGDTLSAVFDLGGMDTALKPVREACAW